MSFSIDAHITISGGYMIWPLSRGPSKTINFNGGLLIEGDGTLEIQPYSTKIIVYGDVIFRDQCLLQFPMMGIASSPSFGQPGSQRSYRARYTDSCGLHVMGRWNSSRQGRLHSAEYSCDDRWGKEDPITREAREQRYRRMGQRG